jgi:hypothetical protein
MLYRMGTVMDNLYRTGLNMGRVFNYKCGCVSIWINTCSSSKQPSLQLKTQPKQLLGFFPLDKFAPQYSVKVFATTKQDATLSDCKPCLP